MARTEATTTASRTVREEATGFLLYLGGTAAFAAFMLGLAALVSAVFGIDATGGGGGIIPVAP